MLGHAALGRYAIGQTAVLLSAIAADAAAYTLTGNASLGQQLRKADAAAFTVSGQAAARQITGAIAAGSFEVTGNTAPLLRGLRLVASGTIATYGHHFLFGALGEFPLGGGETGATAATLFELTGNNSTGERVTAFVADAGSFVFAGFDAGLVPTIYPPKIRMFPSVGRGVRGRSAGGGAQIRTSVGGGMRARAFGG